ncbi:MAG: undecaprenyl diphosphate synthase family protein, partial [Clostridiales bacterium]|nr:undecaprenyl diphosphate synthase family protein [Clostridiales bacterium]
MPHDSQGVVGYVYVDVLQVVYPGAIDIDAGFFFHVKYLTLYTFSTENKNRPKDEVDSLFHLVVTTINKNMPDLMEKRVRV